MSIKNSLRLLTLFTTFLFTGVVFTKKAQGPLLPGPRGLPLLGSVFQISKSQWLKYTEWQKEFGNRFSLSLKLAAKEFQVR